MAGRLAAGMVVGVSGGVLPAGSRIGVTRVEVDPDGKSMTVFWKVHPAEKGKPATEIAHPAEVVLLERFAGPIRFREAAAKRE